MIQNKELQKFTEKMEKMMAIKVNKYQDTWKTCNLGTLRAKLQEQVKKIIINTLVPDSKWRVKKSLIHIANYCYFLYRRLTEEGDSHTTS